jgi:hypothetical protein
MEKSAAKEAQQSLETGGSLPQWKLRLFMDVLILG